MALLQDRYIKITTGKGSTSVAERNLQTLVFTDSTGNYDANGIKRFNSASDVTSFFGENSKESTWAASYFGFANPNGNAPTSLMFAKINAGETPKKAFTRVVGKTNDFGIFTYLIDLSADKIKDIAMENAALNYRFQFVAAVTLAMVKEYKTKKNPVAELKNACVGSDGTSGTHLIYQKNVSLTGDSLEVPKTYILAAILSSIDWSQEDGVVSPMFRTLSGEVPDVYNDASVMTDGGSGSGEAKTWDWDITEIGADDLDDYFFNYYANVQINGAERSFYQKGVNSDKETSLVYMGEVWLKSEISTRIIDLMLSISKIKANVEGNAKVYATIDSACSVGVANGVIEPNREFDANTRQKINTQAGDSAAADIVASRGYWLKTWITKDSDGVNYKAKYLLIYAKEDVVVKVEGSDVLY